MIQTDSIQSLRKHIGTWKQQGKKIALVPTMGNLHQGHLSLVEKAQELADITIATIFVNPIQFDKETDLNAYPRTLEEDAAALEAVQCDLLFAPSTDTMYGNSSASTRIEVGGISELLEGESRPGHFSGVATVVSKLFNLTTPDIAIFGEKDFQQLMVIRRMAEDLDFNIEIIGHPTVRETDGLAMSSRNGYLTDEERKKAPVLYQVLTDLKHQLVKNSKPLADLKKDAIAQLAEAGFKPDYIEIRRQQDLTPPTNTDKKLVILASAWLGKARLIDNLAFDLVDQEAVRE